MDGYFPSCPTPEPPPPRVVYPSTRKFVISPLSCKATSPPAQQKIGLPPLLPPGAEKRRIKRKGCWAAAKPERRGGKGETMRCRNSP